MARLTSIILGLAWAVSSVAPASAAIVTGSFSGEIGSGADVSGYFTGVSGTDLSGGAVSGTFRYDTDLAPDAGGGDFGGDGVVNWLGFTIKIAGRNYSFGSTPLGGDTIHAGYVADGADELNLSLQRGDSAATESIGLSLFGSEFLSGPGLPVSFAFAGDGFGTVLIQTDDAVADAVFSITSAQTDAVPEPRIWANLIAGFALLGAALRLRPQRRLSPL